MTIVEPAAFRTNWPGPSMRQSATTIDDYAPTAGTRRASTLATYGHQPGDPARAAQAIIDAITAEQPPLRLLLGKAAYDIATAKLDSLKTTFDGWREVTLSTDFPRSRSQAERRASPIPGASSPPCHTVERDILQKPALLRTPGRTVLNQPGKPAAHGKIHGQLHCDGTTQQANCHVSAASVVCDQATGSCT